MVVQRNGFKHGDHECDIVLILCIMLMEDERVMEENDLAINILDKNNECFRSAVNLFIPSEVGYDRKVNTEEGTGDGLHLCLQPAVKVLSKEY